MKSALFFIIGALAALGGVWIAGMQGAGRPQPPAGLSTNDAVLVRLESKPAPLPAEATDREKTIEELGEAELDHQLLTERLLAAKKTVEEAVVMVREQKENFEFAQERYEKLMPLVETGALEPLAASQIQSAYISARASLAQAKFLLGQASRDYQSEAARRRLLSASLERVEALRKALDISTQNETAGRAGGNSPAQDDAGGNSPPPGAIAEATAFFLLPSPSDTGRIAKGTPVRISLPGFPGWAFDGKISSSKIVSSAGELPVRIETKIWMESLPPGFERGVSACEVIVAD